MQIFNQVHWCLRTHFKWSKMGKPCKHTQHVKKQTPHWASWDETSAISQEHVKRLRILHSFALSWNMVPSSGTPAPRRISISLNGCRDAQSGSSLKTIPPGHLAAWQNSQETSSYHYSKREENNNDSASSTRWLRGWYRHFLQKIFSQKIDLDSEEKWKQQQSRTLLLQT